MKRVVLYIIGILLVIIGLVLNTFSFWRICLLLLGIILITINLTLNYPKRIMLLISMPLILLLFTYTIDTILVTNLKRIPVYSYRIKSSEKVRTYNSFLYRVIDCDNNLIVDYGYKLSYSCSNDALDVHEINAFLSEALESYKSYHHKYIKLNGKVSKISGANILELSSYVEDDDSLNGYVTFNTEYTIRIKTNSDLTKYRIFDEVEVIGLVNNITKDKTITIELIDAIVLPSTIYDDYSIEILESNNQELVSYVEKNNIYLLGLQNIFVHYDDKHIYELNYLIADERIVLDDILKNKEYKELKDQDDVVQATVYELDKFKIMKCQNAKTIFSSLKTKLKIDYCN